MSEPIKVGDLVQVVGPLPCCGGMTHMNGHVFTVTGFNTTGAAPCKKCRRTLPEWTEALGGGDGVWIGRLKKIPPLADLEGQRTQEPLRIPKKEAA